MLLPEVAYLPEDYEIRPTAGRGTRLRRSRSRGRRGLLVAAAALSLLVIGGATGAWAGATSFKDVPPGHAFHEEIMWGAKHDLAAGFKDGTFHPADPMTRQAGVAFLKRYKKAITTHAATIAQGQADSFQATAQCPAGKSPIAGGGRIDGSNLMLTDSHPTTTGWYARWESDNNASIDSGGTVWVICKPDDTSS